MTPLKPEPVFTLLESPTHGWYLGASLTIWIRSKDGRGQFYTAAPLPVATLAQPGEIPVMSDFPRIAWRSQETRWAFRIRRKREIREGFDSWKDGILKGLEGEESLSIPPLEDYFGDFQREARKAVRLNAINRLSNWACVQPYTLRLDALKLRLRVAKTEILGEER